MARRRAKPQFPLEVWQAIASFLLLPRSWERGNLNNLSQTCKKLCAIIRPILYRTVDLARPRRKGDGPEPSPPPALHTLRLLSQENSNLPRYVRTLLTPSFFRASDEDKAELFHATLQALRQLKLLEHLTLSESPFGGLGPHAQKQFFRVLRTLNTSLRGLDTGMFGTLYHPTPKRLQIQSLTLLRCHISDMFDNRTSHPSASSIWLS